MPCRGKTWVVILFLEKERRAARPLGLEAQPGRLGEILLLEARVAFTVGGPTSARDPRGLVREDTTTPAEVQVVTVADQVATGPGEEVHRIRIGVGVFQLGRGPSLDISR